jgi:NADH-ubiquinone oxidoreductase chain 2
MLIKINASNIWYAYNLEPFDEFWNYFFNWEVSKGGGSDALYNLLFVSSLFSLMIGTVLGLAQSQIKRLLAYSTIAHLGFILLALSINTEEALDSFLFYIIQYTITNVNVFLIIIAFNYLLSSLVKNNLVIKDIKYISELTNQYDKNPILTLSFIICLLSMAGIPHFIGFFAKLFVLFSSISVSQYFLVIIAIIVSVISTYYYLRIIKILYTEDNNTSAVQESVIPSSASSLETSSLPYGGVTSVSKEVRPQVLTDLHSLIIAVLSLFLVLFFLNPDLILTSTRVLSISLFNF